MESINSYYRKNLKDDELKYLLDRGITSDSIEAFEIGFAKESKEQIEYLKNNFYSIDDSCDIGVLSKGESGLYSRLINRITFPIRNHTGKLIGFGGRTTVGHSAKYVNSIQTKLFDKSRNFYGLNIAKEHIYKKGTMVVTEGYLDVVMMHQANIKTAVATMGTSLTEAHIPIIKKMGCKVLLCYDGDSAGLNASFKASILLAKHQIDGTVVIFPNGLDPADMIKEGRAKELISLMKSGTPLIAYVIKNIAKGYDLSNPYEKDKAKVECINFLDSLENPIVADAYKPMVANTLGIDISYLQSKKQNEKPKEKEKIAHSLSEQINANIELSLIATAMDDFNAFGILSKINDSEIFNTYKDELKKLIDGGDGLEWVSLKDGVVVYGFNDFKRQLCIFLIDFTLQKIQYIKSSLEFGVMEKIEQVTNLQKKILDYKKGIV